MTALGRQRLEQLECKVCHFPHLEPESDIDLTPSTAPQKSFCMKVTFSLSGRHTLFFLAISIVESECTSASLGLSVFSLKLGTDVPYTLRNTEE